jgi:hypothetical protein
MISSHPRCCADNKRQFGGSEFPANPGVITPAQLCALTSDEKDDQRSVCWPVDDGPLRTFVTDCRASLMIVIIIVSVYSTVNKHFLTHLIRHSPNAGVVEAEIAALNGHSRRWLPWQCSRHPFESFGNGGAALPATSLCECMDFTVLGACLRLKENKVILPAHSRAAAP